MWKRTEFQAHFGGRLWDCSAGFSSQGKEIRERKEGRTESKSTFHERNLTVLVLARSNHAEKLPGCVLCSSFPAPSSCLWGPFGNPFSPFFSTAVPPSADIPSSSSAPPSAHFFFWLSFRLHRPLYLPPFGFSALFSTPSPPLSYRHQHPSSLFSACFSTLLSPSASPSALPCLLLLPTSIWLPPCSSLACNGALHRACALARK